MESNLTNFIPDFLELVNEFGFSGDITVNGNGDKNFSVEVIINGKSSIFCYEINYNTDLVEKRLKKRYSKLSLYKALSEATNKSMPWGALTGVRPTKLCYSQGKGYREFLKNTMLVSDQKLDLLDEIISSQKPYYIESEDNLDLFIGIPFCPSRCYYCSFLSNIISKEKRINEYIEALIAEIEAVKPIVKAVRSIYIGGGTPVSIDDELFEKLLVAVNADGKTEFTLEAGRPDCITEKKLELMKKYGVTRVCINPQTFCNETLKFLGRNHTAQDILDKLALTKSYGFKINMDLIAGLYGEAFSTFKNSIDKTIELSPDNITVHTLCIKKGSKLSESEVRLSDDKVGQMLDYSSKAVKEAGYFPYYMYRQKYMAGNFENVGYSKKGSECIYNIDIMEEISNIIACGAGAISKKVDFNQKKIERIAAPKDTEAYLNKVNYLIEEKRRLFFG